MKQILLTVMLTSLVSVLTACGTPQGAQSGSDLASFEGSLKATEQEVAGLASADEQTTEEAVKKEANAEIKELSDEEILENYALRLETILADLKLRLETLSKDESEKGIKLKEFTERIIQATEKTLERLEEDSNFAAQVVKAARNPTPPGFTEDEHRKRSCQALENGIQNEKTPEEIKKLLKIQFERVCSKS